MMATVSGIRPGIGDDVGAAVRRKHQRAAAERIPQVECNLNVGVVRRIRDMRSEIQHVDLCSAQLRGESQQQSRAGEKVLRIQQNSFVKIHIARAQKFH